MAGDVIGSFNHGSMGCVLSQACGREEGGLAMQMGELLPPKKLPVKVVVFNSGALAVVDFEMKASGCIDFDTDLEYPDFCNLHRRVAFLVCGQPRLRTSGRNCKVF
jgi:pyruvate dehydrogenase (quinone)